MAIRHIAVGGLTHTTYGLIGEHIAAASILQQGWRCAFAQMDSVDLFAWLPDSNKRLLIQVKSCQLSRTESRLHFQLGVGGVKQVDGKKKKRLPTRADFDIIALVSSEQRACFFMPVTAIKGMKITKAAAFFEQTDLEPDSWTHSVGVIDEISTKQTTLRDNRRGSRTSSDCEFSPANW